MRIKQDKRQAIIARIIELDSQGKGTGAMVAALGMSRRMIQKYKNEIGIKRRCTDYTDIDRMILAGSRNGEIARAVGCTTQKVANRRFALVKAGKIEAKPSTRKAMLKYDEVTSAPMDDPRERPFKALKAKFKKLGLPSWYPIESWLKGQAARQTIEAML